jgi:hypothetical protein
MRNLIERALWIGATATAICFLAALVREGLVNRSGA